MYWAAVYLNHCYIIIINKFTSPLIEEEQKSQS